MKLITAAALAVWLTISIPPAALQAGVMTDTDDTGGEARAWYGDITLSSD